MRSVSATRIGEKALHEMNSPENERRQKDLEHARWRASFFQKKMEAHRQTPLSARASDWDEIDQLNEKRFKASEDELKRLELER